MSYIRAWHKMRYVKGRSNDYIYESVYETKAGKEKFYIEDYGGITDSGMVEILCNCIESHYGERSRLFKEYLKNKLAKRLNVQLRKKTLTEEEVCHDSIKSWYKPKKRELKRVD